MVRRFDCKTPEIVTRRAICVQHALGLRYTLCASLQPPHIKRDIGARTRPAAAEGGGSLRVFVRSGHQCVQVGAATSGPAVVKQRRATMTHRSSCDTASSRRRDASGPRRMRLFCTTIATQDSGRPFDILPCGNAGNMIPWRSRWNLRCRHPALTFALVIEGALCRRAFCDRPARFGKGLR